MKAAHLCNAGPLCGAVACNRDLITEACSKNRSPKGCDKADFH